MNDRQLLRYSRHILLDAFGIEAQERLLASRALVVGAGGLGSPAALYLAAAGIGTLVLADGDTVDASNLQRQILHTEKSLGKMKAESGIETLARINPEIHLVALARRLAGAELEREVAAADVVLDCSDNFATRHAINRACVRHSRPLVSGAAIGFSGQVSVFDLTRPASPCYHCLFPDGEEGEELRCALTGVFAPLTGMVGSLQAGEAIKCLTGVGTLLCGRLLLIDALDPHWRTLTFARDPACPVCGHRPLPG